MKRFHLIFMALVMGVATFALPAGAAIAADTDIIVLGGSGAVSDTVEAQLWSCTAGSVIRLSGSNRYATAAAISAATFDPGVAVAAIATGDNFPDALAGGAAAGAAGGPVLLVTKDSIPAPTAQELTRLKPQRIVVLGGTGAVSASVEAALEAFTAGPVTRISGPDRYATAAATSAATFSPATDTAWVATGTNFPDALAGGPAAIINGGPILLVQKDAIPASIKAEIVRLNLGTIKVLGGLGAVSAAVEAELSALVSVSVTRFAGADRYETAARVSEGRFSPGVGAIMVATGENFPDALAGGPAAAARNGPLLLVKKNALPGSTATEIGRLTGTACGSTPPPPPGAFTTAKDILDGKVPVDGEVVMRGEAVRRIDQDDYRFSDGTGEIRIDIQDHLDQNIPLATCMVIAGVWDGAEVEVDAYAACSVL